MLTELETNKGTHVRPTSKSQMTEVSEGAVQKNKWMVQPIPWQLNCHQFSGRPLKENESKMHAI